MFVTLVTDVVARLLASQLAVHGMAQGLYWHSVQQQYSRVAGVASSKQRPESYVHKHHFIPVRIAVPNTASAVSNEPRR
jgi:hypothetical protein